VASASDARFLALAVVATLRGRVDTRGVRRPIDGGVVLPHVEAHPPAASNEAERESE
jgi:hypothetical protein